MLQRQKVWNSAAYISLVLSQKSRLSRYFDWKKKSGFLIPVWICTRYLSENKVLKKKKKKKKKKEEEEEEESLEIQSAVLLNKTGNPTCPPPLGAQFIWI